MSLKSFRIFEKYVFLRASLRQSLRHLRTALGPGLKTSRETIELTTPIECDVKTFEALVETDPAQAVTFNIPSFMTGFAVPHAPDLEEWIGTSGCRPNPFIQPYCRDTGDWPADLD